MEENRVLLFVDDEHIETTRRVSRVFEQPRKFGPVVLPDRPWEAQCVIVYGSALPTPDGTGYQMWYQSYDRSQDGPGRARFCHATSSDGVHWDKPALGIYDLGDGGANNVILTGWGSKWLGTMNVVFDAGETEAARRYKMLFSANEEGPGLFAAFSPDGTHWSIEKKPVSNLVSDRTTLLFDSAREIPFVAFTRRHGKLMMDEFRRRVIYRIESKDFLNWTEPEPMLVPDLTDSWDVQFYGMPAFRYRDLYLGGLKRLWSTPDRIDTELVWSRDTVTWGRSRVPFLANGTEESWDSAWVGLASSPPLEINGQLFFYFEGRRQAHGQTYPFPQGAIGLAVLPKDRFAAIEAGPAEGYVETKAVRWEGDELAVNMRTNRHGYLRAGVVGKDGREIAGFSAADCIPLSGDKACARLAWTGGTLRDLKERLFGLRFCLVNTRLYAISSISGCGTSD